MARSTVLVFLCLIGVAFSFSTQFASVTKSNILRDPSNECSKIPEYTCLAIGATCSTPSDCTICVNAYNQCTQNVTNSGCDCSTAYVDCLAAIKNNIYCPSSAPHEQCLSSYTNCSCGTPYTGVTSLCPDFSVCSNSTKKCVEKGGLGAQCNDDNDCTEGQTSRGLECRDNVCHYPEYSGDAGEPCQEDEDCAGYRYDESTCVSGKCTGVAIGGNCTISASCVQGAFCNSTGGLCQALGTAGDKCSPADMSCALPYVCGRTNNTCVRFMSQPAGAACYSLMECNLGLMCKNGVCGSQVSSRNCTSDNTCSVANGYTGSCSCDPYLGYTRCQPDTYAYPSACADSFNTVASCFERSGCTRLGECQACSNEQLCLNQCVVDAYNLDDEPASCNRIPFTCGATTTTAGSTTGSGATAIVASVAIILAAILVVV